MKKLDALYIVNIGYICSCGCTATTNNPKTAKQLAEQHIQEDHDWKGLSAPSVIDYRSTREAWINE